MQYNDMRIKETYKRYPTDNNINIQSQAVRFLRVKKFEMWIRDRNTNTFVLHVLQLQCIYYYSREKYYSHSKTRSIQVRPDHVKIKNNIFKNNGINFIRRKIYSENRFFVFENIKPSQLWLKIYIVWYFLIHNITHDIHNACNSVCLRLLDQITGISSSRC